MLKEFKEFIARANVIDLAVGGDYRRRFREIVTSLVEGIIMPPIGLLLGKVDFSSLFLVLDHSKGVPVSLADAKAKAIPVIAYGASSTSLSTSYHRASDFYHRETRQQNPEERSGEKGLSALLDGNSNRATRCAACCADLNAA